MLFFVIPRRVRCVERLAVGREPFGRGLGPRGTRPAPPSHASAARGRSPSPQGTGAPQASGVRTGDGLVSTTAPATDAGQRFPSSGVCLRADGPQPIDS
jgi:hypothetical protein